MVPSYAPKLYTKTLQFLLLTNVKRLQSFISSHSSIKSLIPNHLVNEYEKLQIYMLVKMCKPMGRSDDMLIIKGVNVFPSQIESVLLKISKASPNYQIVVDRVNNSDTFEIRVELNDDMFSDTVKSIEDLEKKISNDIHNILGIKAKIRLVEPKSIPRSEGKAVRVIDKRKLV